MSEGRCHEREPGLRLGSWACRQRNALPTAAPCPPTALPRSAGFAGALEMQVEALSDRLQYAQMQVISRPREAPGAAAAAAAEAQQLRAHLAEAQEQAGELAQQNRTLRATAARLGKALAAVMQREMSTGGGAGGGRRHKSALGASAGGGAAAAEVLAQLTAVEGILADML